jgi:hypothetical protein
LNSQPAADGFIVPFTPKFLSSSQRERERVAARGTKDSNADSNPDREREGLVMHPGANKNSLPLKAMDAQGQVTFAPENTRYLVKIPPPKSDFFGVGYDPAVENPEVGLAIGLGLEA